MQFDKDALAFEVGASMVKRMRDEENLHWDTNFDLDGIREMWVQYPIDERFAYVSDTEFNRITSDLLANPYIIDAFEEIIESQKAFTNMFSEKDLQQAHYDYRRCAI